MGHCQPCTDLHTWRHRDRMQCAIGKPEETVMVGTVTIHMINNCRKAQHPIARDSRLSLQTARHLEICVLEILNSTTDHRRHYQATHHDRHTVWPLIHAGHFVVNLVFTWGTKYPSRTPSTMAAMIHTGRSLSNHDRPARTEPLAADEAAGAPSGGPSTASIPAVLKTAPE